MGFLQSLTKVVIGICAALYVRDKSIELLQSLRSSRPKAVGGSALEIRGKAKEVLKLNDSVYELYRPSEGTPSMDVVFFHGFQHGNYEKAHLFTWLSEDETCIWPQDWLKAEFPRARILTVSYNARLPSEDLLIVVENLLSDLLSGNIGQEPRCPVVLVGHSFGGLVIKKLCVHAFNKKQDLFFNSLKGIFFYSTPHHGLSASFVSSRPGLSRSPFLPYLEILNKESTRLHDDFDGLWKKQRTCKIAGLGESVKSKWGTFDDLVVPEGSSRYGNDFLIESETDHISISRPRTEISKRFTYLTDLLRAIVKDSDNERPENFQELPVESKTGKTGIKEVVEDVTRMFKETTRLGFYGMVGIGKTTIVKALFNNVEGSFHYTCFIKEDEIQVKDIILSNMHYRGRKITGNGLKSNIKGRKLLLVLDGVTLKEDLDIAERFIRDMDVDEASQVVATSRNKELLASEGYILHPIGFLSIPSSTNLFLTCAPNGLDPPFQEHVNDIVEMCDKLPLTLEVVGKYLSRKNEESDWKLILRALDEARNMGILKESLWAKLKISYDSLDEKEKYMFLDAATVFYQYDVSIAMAAWTNLDGYQRYHWQRLVNFSLVWEDPDGERTRINMQKQLLSMGRMIALTPQEKYSKEGGYMIWNNDEEAFKLLFNNKDEDYMKDIVALKSCSRKIKREVIDWALDDLDSGSQDVYIPISGSALCKMRKLRYLWLEGFHIAQRQDSPLPSTIVYLHFSSMSFSNFPFIPRHHRCMIILSLNKIVGVDTLPANFGNLQSLQILRIENNDSLEGLPDSIGKLAMLTYLSIKLCPKLRRLPDRLGDLKALETLRICSCKSLLALPESIGSLQTLKVVEIMGCDWESLPDTLGSLSKLKHLRIEKCGTLKSLPDSLRKLMALEILTIDSCDSLSQLPNYLEYLLNLKVIRITKCRSLRRLPGEFENLSALQHIELNEIRLRCVPDLQMIRSLKTLRLSWCPTQTFPSISLPDCLQGQVTGENYTSPLAFSVTVERKFEAVPPGDFQHVPTGIVGTLEGV